MNPEGGFRGHHPPLKRGERRRRQRGGSLRSGTNLQRSDNLARAVPGQGTRVQGAFPGSGGFIRGKSASMGAVFLPQAEKRQGNQGFHSP